MTIDENDISFENIDWRQFQQLCYDLLEKSKYHSFVSRQGEINRGWEIKAKRSPINSLVEVGDEKWFILCKHHSKSLEIVDIASKIDRARAERPDHFLLMTTSCLAPGTRAWIDNIKSEVEFKIHVLEGNNLKRKIFAALSTTNLGLALFDGRAPIDIGVASKVLHNFYTIRSEEKEEYHLSLREREVLGLLVEGYSYKMIADKLRITYDTVRAHMKKIYEKLHVASMTEAVAKAINQKLFSGK